MKKISLTLSCLIFVPLLFFVSSSIGYVQGIMFNSCFSPPCSQYQLTTGYTQSPLYTSLPAYQVSFYSLDNFFPPTQYYTPSRWPFFNGSTFGSYTNFGMDFNSGNRLGNGSRIASVYSGDAGFGAAYASSYSIRPFGDPLSGVGYSFSNGIDMINQYPVFPPGMYTNNLDGYSTNMNNVFSRMLDFIPEMKYGLSNVPVEYGNGFYSSISDNRFGDAYAGGYANSPFSQTGNIGFPFDGFGGFTIITPFGSLIPFGSPGLNPQVIQPDANVDPNIIADPNKIVSSSITGHVTIKILNNSDDSVYIKIASEGSASKTRYDISISTGGISQIILPKYSSLTRFMVSVYFPPDAKTAFASLPLDLDDFDNSITLVLTVDVAASSPISIHEE